MKGEERRSDLGEEKKQNGKNEVDVRGKKDGRRSNRPNYEVRH